VRVLQRREKKQGNGRKGSKRGRGRLFERARRRNTTAAAAAVRPAEAAQTRRAEAVLRTAAAVLCCLGGVWVVRVEEVSCEMWPRTFEELVHCCIFLPVPGDRAPWEF